MLNVMNGLTAGESEKAHANDDGGDGENDQCGHDHCHETFHLRAFRSGISSRVYISLIALFGMRMIAHTVGSP